LNYKISRGEYCAKIIFDNDNGSFAAQILALSDLKLAEQLVNFKKNQAKKVIEKDSAVQ